MNLIKFSVLMSTYNKENPEYLMQSIESIINQTIKPSEIVIVKDGPLNNNLNLIIDFYKTNYEDLFKIISIDENAGLGNALNIGIRNCSNELIARMDTDDICLSNRFELQIREFEKDSELSICSGYILEFEDNIEKICSIRKVPISYNEILKYSKKRNPFNHMAVMYKKSKVIEAGNYVDISLAEDYYLWVRMLMNGCKAINIDKPLVYVRGGKSMIIRRGGLSYAIKIVKLQKLFYELKYIKMYELIINCLVRITVSIVPNFIREIFYRKILRRNNFYKNYYG